MKRSWALAFCAVLGGTPGCRKDDASKASPPDDAARPAPADAARADDASPPADAGYELIERADAGPPDIEVPDIVTDP